MWHVLFYHLFRRDHILKIIVCDDEEKQRKKISDMIRAVYPDAEITECERADEAAATARTAQILVMDIDMGDDMDGMEASQIIYKRGKGYCSLPLIIFVTGYPERMQEAFSVHAFFWEISQIMRFMVQPCKTMILRLYRCVYQKGMDFCLLK